MIEDILVRVVADLIALIIVSPLIWMLWKYLNRRRKI